MHTAFALERMIKNEPLVFSEDEKERHQLEMIYQKTAKTLKTAEKKTNFYINKR